jgi:hypothetical protein
LFISLDFAIVGIRNENIQLCNVGFCIVMHVFVYGIFLVNLGKDGLEIFIAELTGVVQSEDGGAC